MGIFDIFRKQTKKERMRDKMEKIRERGKTNENYHDMMNPNDTKTYHGADRVHHYYDKAGRKRSQPIELKYNTSRLSKLQRKRAQFVKRTHPDGTTEITHRDGTPAYQDLNGKYVKEKPNQNQFWNTTPRKKKSSGYDDMFGMGSSGSGRKKKSSGYDDMFGF